MTWEGEGAGTALQCRGRLHIIAIVFLTIWFGFICFAGSVFLVAPSETVQGDRIAALINIAFVLGVGATIFGFSRLLAQNEEKYLLEFVRYMLDAEERRTDVAP